MKVADKVKGSVPLTSQRVRSVAGFFMHPVPPGRLATGRPGAGKTGVMVPGENSLYVRVGGFDKIFDLCERWHQLCLADPAAAHPFEHGVHPQHSERLAAYLAEAFGGPALYTGGYGDESYVQKIHACNGMHIELDEACLAAFDQALADVGIVGEPGAEASAYFRRATVEQRQYSTSDAVVADGLPLNYA